MGALMEETVQMVGLAREEAERCKETLQDLKNEVSALADIIQPELANQVARIRSARMAATSEVHQALSVMKDMRAFFMEKDYKAEIERVDRFIRLCRELEDLKRDGVLDVVAELAIRLAVSEVKQ